MRPGAKFGLAANADKLLTLHPKQAFARGHGFADTVLLGGNHSGHADVKGADAAVNLGMGDEAFFQTQDIQRLHPIGTAAHGFGARHQIAEQSLAVAGGNGNFIPLLTRERDAEQPRLNAAQTDRAGCHKGEIPQGRIEQGVQQRAGLGTSDGELRPSLGHGNKPQIPIGAMGLMDEIKVAHHQTGGSGGCGHQIVVVAQPRRGAIVQHQPILSQHQPIANAVQRQGGKRVGINKVQKARGVTALNVDFTKGRDISHPDGVSDIANLAVAAVTPMRLAGFGEIAGAVPKARLNHRRAPVA